MVSLEKRQAVSTLPSDMEDAMDDGQTPARMRQGWEWTVGSMRREHTHDVKALAIHEQSLDERTEGGGIGVARKGPVLVSGGVDASLSLYSVPGFKTQASNDFTRKLRAGTCCCRACSFAVAVSCLRTCCFSAAPSAVFSRSWILRVELPVTPAVGFLGLGVPCCART